MPTKVKSQTKANSAQSKKSNTKANLVQLKKLAKEKVLPNPKHKLVGKASDAPKRAKGEKVPELKVIPPASVIKPKDVDYTLSEVQSTTDYEQFKIIKGNRDINHAKKLKADIMADNLLAINPILVNDRMEIINGQGRTEAVKMIRDEEGISLKLYYQIASKQTGNRGLKTVQAMNANTTNWKVGDFTKSYSDLGNENYTTFVKFSEEYPQFKDVAIRMILTNNSQHGSLSCNISTFKKGKFEVVNSEAKAKKIADSILAYQPFFDNSAGTYRIFVGVIMELLRDKNFTDNQDELIRKLHLEENRGKLHGQMNSISFIEYKAILNSVLNSRRREGKVYFNGVTQETIDSLVK